MTRWPVGGLLCLWALTAAATARDLDADLVRAAEGRLREAAIHLLDAGADVESAAEDGTTALMWAARHGDAVLFDELLRRGADPRRSRADGYCLVMAAAESGRQELFSRAARLAGFNAVLTDTGYSLLMAAARSGNLPLFERARQHDPAVRRITDEGYSLLMAAAEGGHPRIFALTRQVLDQPADLAARTAHGDTLLHYAALGGSPEILGSLLTSRTPALDPNAQNRAGETPALIAARAGKSRNLRLLIDAGADPNLPDLRGRGPLHYSARAGHRNTTAVLLSASADPNQTDRLGRTPVHALLAYLQGCGMVRPYTRQEERALVEAEECLRLLLVHGGNPNIADTAGTTAAHVLAGSHFQELVPMLRAAGADFSRRNAAGETALDLARHAGYRPMIRVLEGTLTATAQ